MSDTEAPREPAANPAHRIATRADLEARYGAVSPRAQLKEVDHVPPVYAAFIAAAPFVALATAGPEGLDVTPRGDPAGFVQVHDPKTLLLPDRPGNNRLDSLRNILEDPRVALLFLIPGVGDTLRVNGRAEISADPALLERLAHNGKPPATALVIHVERVYFHCAKAFVRSGLWRPETWPEDRGGAPTPGVILEALATEDAFDGAAFDAAYPGRIKETLY